MPSLACSDSFLLGEGEAGLGHRARAIRGRYASGESNDRVAALARGEVEPSEPVAITQDEGREPMDYMGTTLAAGRLISERFRTLLVQGGFTGWRTYPVRVELSDGRVLDGYHGLAVTGRAGPIDDSLSESVVIPPPVPEGRASRGLRGICFEPASWDGSDLFMCGDYLGVAVHRSVRDAIVEAQISNVELRCLAQIERKWQADGTVIGS